MNDRRSLCLMGCASGFAGWLGLPWAAAAQTSPPATGPRMVVELFTSQGCSSCPPADALMNELAGQPDVIALTLPVDYWDYLGWKDTLASPAHTQRQKAYAYARGDRQVYTPQAVVNGVAHAIGSKRNAIERLAAASRSEGKALTTPVALARVNGRWAAQVPAGAAPGAAQLVAMAISKSCDVAIGRGENADKKIAYSNVVRAIAPLGEWTGAAKTVEIDPSLLAQDGVDGLAVLLQATLNGKPGAILGAAKIDSL